MKKVTFIELYRKEVEKPTPRQAFIAEVARVTEKSESTVKQWVSGIQVPDRLSIKVIANHFGCDPESLFPGRGEK